MANISEWAKLSSHSGR